MIEKNKINQINYEEYQSELDILRKNMKNNNDFVGNVDLINVVDDKSFIATVSKALMAPTNDRIYEANLNGFRDDIADLWWMDRGQKYQSYWLFVKNFDEMIIRDGESGWTGKERKQQYYEVFQDDLIKWWTEDIAKYGGVDGKKHIRDFTVIFVENDRRQVL